MEDIRMKRLDQIGVANSPKMDSGLPGLMFISASLSLEQSCVHGEIIWKQCDPFEDLKIARGFFS